MNECSAMGGGAPEFMGRARERAALDELINRVRGAEGASLVMRGEAGVGKTALAHYFADRASGCGIARIAGSESELAMPFAGVHQLCGPLLEHLDALPEPQRRALRLSFRLELGNPPDL